MKSITHFRQILIRLACNRNFIITLVLAVGLSPIYLFPEYFFPIDDATGQLLPFLFETKRMLSTGIPWWTWQSFLGDNFIGSYAYYTFTRPLLLIVCLLPYKYISAGLLASVYFNFLILGWLVSYYLRIMGFDKKLRLIGSLLFSLSCYIIGQLIYCMFFEPVQAFVILLICIERFLQGRRWSLTTLTLGCFTVAFINYYFMPASMIACTIYFLCRVAYCYQDRWRLLILKGAGCAALGVLMASVVLVPIVSYLSDSPRADMANLLNYGNNWALRLLSLMAPMAAEERLGLFDIDSGFYTNTAYLGIFGIFPFVLYAARNRRSWLTTVCIIFIICLITPLNGIFCLYSNQYYTRWSYALIMMLLLAALSYLNMQRGRKIPRRPAMIYSAFSFYYLLSVYCYGVFMKIRSGHTYLDRQWEIYLANGILFILNSVALLLLTRRPIMSNQWMRTCLVSIVVITILQTLFVSYRSALYPIKKNDLYWSIVRLNKSRIECDTFNYRNYFERHPDRADCDNADNHHLVCNRPALSTFISTINPASARLAHILAHRSVWYVNIDRYYESAATLLSVKDFHSFGDYPVVHMPQAALRGDRYIPMGMAYDRYSLMEDSLADVGRAKSHDILRGMLASMLIDKADEPELSRYMKLVEFRDSLPFDSLVAARRAYTCDSFKGDSHGFTATISLPDTMVVMFSAAADPGFTATIDGKPSKIYNVNMGMSASIVPAGRHTIRYEFFPPGLREGALMSLVALLIFLGLVLFEFRSSHRAN